MNIRQAAWLADRIQQSPGLELLAPVVCNIVCFRCVPKGLESVQLDEFNRQVLQRIQASGIATPSAYTVRGAFAIRCSITNHRTTRADLELFFQAISEVVA